MKLRVVDINFTGTLCDECLRKLHSVTYASELDKEIIVQDSLELYPSDVCQICGKS